MFRTLVLAGIAGCVVAILGHYVAFGPRRVDLSGARRTVRRFRVFEILLHAVTAASFVALALTGLIAVVGQRSPLHGWLWILHIAAAPLFSLGLTGMVVSWALDCRFAGYDWEWVKVLGGYLWGGKHAPAARFNAGQKGYFWAVGLLGLTVLLTGLGRAVPIFDATGQEWLYQLHRYSALLLMLAGMVHIYLGTLANPGTFLAMVLGKVFPAWAAHHHPLWWRKLQGGEGD